MEKQLPKEYENSKVILPNFGGFMFGWSKEIIIKFITDINTNSFVILGGDVLKVNKQNGFYEHTYDNWYVSKRAPKESFEDYAKRSREKALLYIQNYTSNEDIVFSPTITSEVTAGL